MLTSPSWSFRPAEPGRLLPDPLTGSSVTRIPLDHGARPRLCAASAPARLWMWPSGPHPQEERQDTCAAGGSFSMAQWPRGRQFQPRKV